MSKQLKNIGDSLAYFYPYYKLHRPVCDEARHKMRAKFNRRFKAIHPVTPTKMNRLSETYHELRTEVINYNDPFDDLPTIDDKYWSLKGSPNFIPGIVWNANLTYAEEKYYGAYQGNTIYSPASPYWQRRVYSRGEFLDYMSTKIQKVWRGHNARWKCPCFTIWKND